MVVGMVVGLEGFVPDHFWLWRDGCQLCCLLRIGWMGGRRAGRTSPCSGRGL